MLAGLILIQYRLAYTDVESGKPLKVTTWDAFGYYMYLPSAIIYDDMTELKWLPEMDSTYQLTGGTLYQANRHTNGKYVYKYLGGVSLIQAPFFFIGHAIALSTNYKADGFSPPYQYAIAFGAIFYCILALFLLRNILLRYYDDRSVALSLLLLLLATNLIQYISVDGAMSHSFIFPLYALILYTTIKWHETPKLKWAALTGLIIGLATISRPTEAIMLFIPLLWNTQTKEAAKVKWKQVRENKKHILVAVAFGLLGVAPQLIYWKLTSGSFVYDVGSKWFFLNPFFRVLFGFENGWFIYTPVTLLFIVGFFYMKKYPFRKSVIVFCLLNIWIVIAWSDWKYGATYSTRALVQSYPVFMLAFTGVVERLLKHWIKYLFLVFAGFLIYVNVFQIWQYNEGILHYREMNRIYYSAIYLDSDPTPLDMSLLDTDEKLCFESEYKRSILFKNSSPIHVSNEGEFPDIIARGRVDATGDRWIKAEIKLKADSDFMLSYLNCKVQADTIVKEKVFRLAHAMSSAEKVNTYVFYVHIPMDFKESEVLLFVSSFGDFEGEVKEVKLSLLKK